MDGNATKAWFWPYQFSVRTSAKDTRNLYAFADTCGAAAIRNIYPYLNRQQFAVLRQTWKTGDDGNLALLGCLVSSCKVSHWGRRREEMGSSLIAPIATKQSGSGGKRSISKQYVAWRGSPRPRKLLLSGVRRFTAEIYLVVALRHNLVFTGESSQFPCPICSMMVDLNNGKERNMPIASPLAPLVLLFIRRNAKLI